MLVILFPTESFRAIQSHTELNNVEYVLTESNIGVEEELEKTKEHQTLIFCFGMFRSAR